MNRTDKALIVILLIAVIAAIYLAVGRMQIERRNRTVEIIIDANDVRGVAAASGKTFPEMLRVFREAGATAVGIHEATLQELLNSGRVSIGVVPNTPPVLLTPTPTFADELARAIVGKFPHSGASAASTSVHLGTLDPTQLQDTPILLPPDDVQFVREAGLRVVARLGNYPQATPESIEFSAASAARAGAQLVIFREDQVLGCCDLIPETAAAFKRHHLYYGFVEIAEQKGEEDLSRRLSSNLIRVHSISDADLLVISPATAIQRYGRAVRERNIRACYVRTMAQPQLDPTQASTSYVSDVVHEIQREGFITGPPTPYSTPTDWPSPPARWLVTLGVAAGAVLLLRRLVPIGTKWTWFCWLALTGLLLAIAFVKEPLLAPLGGLIAASVFPSLGLAIALQQAHNGDVRPPTSVLYKRALLGLLLASLFSLAGGFLVVGLYAKITYLQGIGAFAGVKLAYLLPVVVAFFVIIAELPGREEPLPTWWARTRQHTEAFLRDPVSWGGAAVIFIALGALAFALMRSGNESVVAPTGLELKMRNTLEAILIARPRTKEFLIGHPALMLAVALVFRRRRVWLPLVAIIAALGQISLLNTYCHFHIPLYLSLLRSVHGVWIGALVGLVIIYLWRVLFDRPARVGD